MKILFSRRGAVLLCFLLLALFLIRPQAGHLRGKISGSISQALGKHVEIGSVHFLFLPRPGFELENLAIRDDPAFGAEPLLRAPEVNARLRLTALIRGRIEISNLSLSEASLNLARDPQGKWNLQDLLERANKISTAPTASKQSRMEFPYIEATRARINFKIGSEKTHFALTDAEFALWQESENAWGVRLRAQPIRTDANLTDTGVINVNGIWQRASALRETPLQFSFQWKQAQIGQASKLVYGSDKGWRGNVIVSGTLAGTPGRLQITVDSSVDGLRKFDVLGGDLRLVAHCGAEYSSVQKMLSNIDCLSPFGAGSLQLKGSASGSPPSYGFSLVATKLPAQSMLELLRNATDSIPNDLVASGSINTTLLLNRSEIAGQSRVELRGDGEAQNLKLSSGNAGSEISLGKVPFALGPGAGSPQEKRPRISASEPGLEIGPVNIALGRPAPLQARASLSSTGYKAALHGDVEVKQLLQIAHMLGIPAPAVAASGSSTVDLRAAGDWNGTHRTKLVGTAQLRSVRAQVRGLNAPLQITNAELNLDENSVRVHNLNASAAEATWRGSMLIPRPCSAANACRFQFNLHVSEVRASALNDLLNPQARKRSWYKFFARGETQVPYLAQARATGKIAIDKLGLGKSVCTHFTSDVDLDAGKLTLENMTGEILGGSATGQLNANFLANPPAYSGSGSLDGVSLTEVADLMHNAWIAGTGNAEYEFKAAGWGLQDLLESVDLSANFNIQNGDFPHVVLTSTSGPLRVHDFSGRIRLRDSKFSFEDAKLTGSSGVYKVSGTVSLGGSLDLKLAGETAIAYNLSGTLIKTRVSQITNPATQASLKP